MNDALLDARDLRMGGRWTRSQQLKNACIRLIVRALVAIADRLPERWLCALGAAAGHVAYVLLGRARRTALANLAASTLARDSARIARASFVQAGRNLARCLLARRAGFRASERVTLAEGAEQTLREALAEGRGALFISAHLGPFEWVASAIAERGHAASVIVRESYDPALDPLVDAHRLMRGPEVIHRGRPRAALRALSALRSGRLLGLLPDLGGRVPTTPAHFIVGPTLVPSGPARLAHATSAPILVGTLEPASKSAYLLRIERIEAGDGEPETTQRVMDALARAIERCPDEWLWMARSLVAAPAIPRL